MPCKTKTKTNTRHRNGWTPERRARQAEMIRSWRPWAHSTGPKTAAGKARTRLNAQTHGFRGERGRIFHAAIREQRKLLRVINRLAAFLDSLPSDSDMYELVACQPCKLTITAIFNSACSCPSEYVMKYIEYSSSLLNTNYYSTKVIS